MILYQGLLASAASWARVGRGFVTSLLDLGLDVQAVRVRGFRFDDTFELPAKLRLWSGQEARELPEPHVGLGFLHPPNLHRLLGAWRTNWFVWEANRCPMQWIEALRDGTDRIFVASNFNRELFAEHVPPEQTVVVRFGYDPAWVERVDAAKELQVSEPFTFLCVAAPHWRKGVLQLLEAFREAFADSDAVRLVIKTTYDPGDSRRQFDFEIPSWQTLLQGTNLAANPLVKIIEETYPEDRMADLYADADVYVGPSWGEAFGLALLDAAACGLPVITTGWGGATDFLPSSPDLVPFELRDAGTDGVYEPTPGAQVAVPDVAALATRMRAHFDNPESSRRDGQLLRQHVAGWTWRAAAEQLLTHFPDAGPSA